MASEAPKAYFKASSLIGCIRLTSGSVKSRFLDINSDSGALTDSIMSLSLVVMKCARNELVLGVTGFTTCYTTFERTTEARSSF
jgi:hypothetical protein